MKRERWSVVVGVALLTVVFGWASWRVMGRGTGAETVLRIGHWQLEAGLREAFEAVARDFEAQHPGVRVEQVIVPQRAYQSWLRTQLVGGTAPDLIEYASFMQNDRLVAAYFRPLDDWLDAPPVIDPIVAGDAAGRPWREAFVDGMASAFNPALGGTFYAPAATFTVRLHGNADLWQRLFGERPWPTDYAGFLTACADIAAARPGLLPVAGSEYNAQFLLDQAESAMLQAQTIAWHGFPVVRPDRIYLAAGLAEGRWSLGDPPVRAALEVRASVARQLPPGYLQQRREDALFQFLQGRSLFYATGSWDAPSLRVQADFPLQVLDLPVPSPTRPPGAGAVLGPMSELAGLTAVGFSVFRGGAHPELARRFLQFLTTPGGARRFSAESGWLSPVRGVPVPPVAAPYAPVIDGYPRGLRLAELGTEMKRVQTIEAHRLKADSVDAYLGAVVPRERAIAREDLASAGRELQSTLRRLERTQLGRALGETGPDYERVDELLALQQFQARWIERALKQTAP